VEQGPKLLPLAMLNRALRETARICAGTRRLLGSAFGAGGGNGSGYNGVDAGRGGIDAAGAIRTLADRSAGQHTRAYAE